MTRDPIACYLCINKGDCQSRSLLLYPKRPTPLHMHIICAPLGQDRDKPFILLSLSYDVIID